MKLSLLTTALGLVSSCLPSVLAGPTPARPHRRWNNVPSGFVYAEDGQFKIDGADFRFSGTNAYWLFLLNEDSDIYHTFAGFAAGGVKVVRVFAFREVVDQPPAFGNYTNIWVDGVATCSQDGITRLQVILDAAQKYCVKVIFSLTNNWSPSTPNDANRPPGYFSNENGGMDTYVQQIKPGGHHDEFYTDPTIFAAYQDYLKCAVPRFKDHPALFSWELANDARCQGASGSTTSSSCNTATITRWVKKTASFVKSLDPNHLVGAGDAGFFCTQPSCPKVNGPTTPPAVEHGSWSALGPAYNGSFGVDSQDICNDPNVDFCNFYIFPDQNYYGVTGGNVPLGFTSASVSQSINFVQDQAASAKISGKPLLNGGIGIASDAVSSTLNNFDSSHIGPKPGQTLATVQEELQARSSIKAASMTAGVNGILSYQHAAIGETPVTGSIIDNSNPAAAIPGSTLRRALAGYGRTPNDGYATNP